MQFDISQETHNFAILQLEFFCNSELNIEMFSAEL
jgi:hypothetical protein